MEIRKFSSKDLAEVLEISRTSFKEPWPKNEFEKYLGWSFAAENKGRIAGFVVGKITGNNGVLKLIAVSRGYRGKGVGRGLIEYIFKYFAENGVREITAHSRLHNKTGCAFLKSFGFEIVRTVKNYYLNGEDAYLMIKKLDG